MNLNEIIKSRVSIKKFKDQTVPSEIIMQLIDDAVYAPNHKMREPWRFILFDKQAQNVLYKRYMSKASDVQRTEQEGVFEKLMFAPHWIAVVMPTLKDIRDELEDMQACAAMIQNLMLLATEKGLGTQWKTPKLIESDKFKEAVGINENEIIIALVMIGYPEVIPPAKPRKLSNKIVENYR